MDGTRGASTPSARFSGAVMEAITVTMLVYLFVLVPTTFAQPGAYEPFTLTDNLIHIITPCLLMADWLLFVRKGAFRWFDPLLWTLIPYAYLVDVDALGVGGVALWIGGLTIALVTVGYIYCALDRILSRMTRRRP
ncbi:Pr6Pr family membrane protein [Microbacterium sp. GXF0217]